MKRHILATILPAMAAILLSSCEKELTFKGKQQKTSIVLFSIATPGDDLSVKLLQSASILDNNYTATVRKGLPEAQVRAFVNGGAEPVLLALDDSDDGNTNDTSAEFSCIYQLKQGDRIRIEAEHDGFDKVTAETTIPHEPDFQIVSVRKESDHEAAMLFHVKICINDPQKEKNYYRMDVSTVTEYDEIIWTGNEENPGEGGSSVKQTYVSYVTDIHSKDPIFTGNGSGWISGDEKYLVENPYFTDSYFDGQSYTFEIYFNADKMTREIWVEIQALSKDLYDYTASLKAYYESDDFSLFSEPVQILCNVENGIGCLGSYTSGLRGIEVE